MAADTVPNSDRSEPRSSLGDDDEPSTLETEPLIIAVTSHAHAPWRSYKEQISSLSGRIVEAQRNLNLLQSLRWDASVEATFRASRGRELPKVGLDWWGSLELGFDPAQRIDELETIARDVRRELGRDDDIGAILSATALEYRDIVRLLIARGTKEFHRLSCRLWGSPKDDREGWGMKVRDRGFALYDALARIHTDPALLPDPSEIPAEKAAEVLKARFDAFFGESLVEVVLDDGLLADASAVGDRVKLRSGAKFLISALCATGVSTMPSEPISRSLGAGCATE